MSHSKFREKKWTFVVITNMHYWRASTNAYTTTSYAHYIHRIDNPKCPFKLQMVQ